MSLIPVTNYAIDQLCPLSEVILMAMGAIGQPASRSHLAYTLVQSGVAPQVESWIDNPVGMTPTLNILRKSGLAIEINNGFWATTDNVIETVCRRAHSKGLLKALAIAGQTAYDTGNVVFNSLSRDLANFRLAFLEGNSKKWMLAQGRLRQIHNNDFSQRDPLANICGQPFDPVWFEELSPEQQSHAAWALLHDQIIHGKPNKDFCCWLDIRSKANLGPVGPILEFLLFEGRLDEAAVIFDKFSIKQRNLVPIVLLKSVFDFTTHRLIEAVAGFESALKILQSKQQNKVVHLPGMMEIFYIMANIGINTIDSLIVAKERLKLLGRRSTNDPLAAMYYPIHCLLLYRQRTSCVDGLASVRNRVAVSSLPLCGLARAIDLICSYLCEERLDFEKVAIVDLELKSLPLGLFKREMAELSCRAKGYINEASLPFLDLVPHSETWEKALEEIHSLTRSEDILEESRLAWFVWRNPESSNLYVIEPREQRRDIKGRWTRGKAISLKRIKTESVAWSFISHQDKVIISCIRENWRGYKFDFDAAIQTLVGHPLVFWSETEVSLAKHTKIVSGQPELHIAHKGNVLELRLCPSLIDSEVIVQVDELIQVKVINVTLAHRKLAAILGEGLHVPAGAETQVLDALRAIAPMVAIHSDIILREEAIRKAGFNQINSSTDTLFLLMPYNYGLKIQIRVEPLEGCGYQIPGEGGANLIFEHNGTIMSVIRDLKREVNTARAITYALRDVLPVSNDCSEWMIDDPKLCMQLLLDLEQIKDLAVIQWPKGGRLIPPRPVNMDALSLTVRRNGNWFEADGKLQIDQERAVSLKELLSASANDESRFVTLNDGSICVLTETFRRRLDDLRVLCEENNVEGLRLHPLSALALEELSEGLGGFDTDSSWSDFLSKLHDALDGSTAELPDGFCAQLRDYQLKGYQWMQRLASVGLGACLADDMGLGKTVQSIAVLLARANAGPSLVLAPTSVCSNWETEIQAFAPQLKITFLGEGDREALLQSAGNFDVFICTYGLLPLEAEHLRQVHWGTVILDEGQNIKNALTKRSQAAMDLQAGFRIVLSGTPIENHLAELWNLFRFLNPGLLGTIEQFRKRFQDPIERNHDTEALVRLRRIVAPFMLRRVKDKVLHELPPMTEIVLELEPSIAERTLLEALRLQCLEELNDSQDKTMKVLAALMRMRRACCNIDLVKPGLNIASSKLEAFLELVEELRESGHRALVFSQFVDHLTILREALDRRGVQYQYLDGSTSARKRVAAVAAFQAGKGEFFLISLKAGGTGLNLTAADYVIHMDPWWNPAVEDQASNRAHRIGQTRPVTVYRLILKGTVEQKILALHKHKRELFDDILSEGAMADHFDNRALLALLQEV
jgi:hypothetical protein